MKFKQFHDLKGIFKIIYYVSSVNIFSMGNDTALMQYKTKMMVTKANN